MKHQLVYIIILLHFIGCSAPKGNSTINSLMEEYEKQVNQNNWQGFISLVHPELRESISKNEYFKKSITKDREKYKNVNYIYGPMSSRSLKKWVENWKSPVNPTHEIKLKHDPHKNGSSGFNLFAHKSENGWFFIFPIELQTEKPIVDKTQSVFEYFYEELEDNQHNWKLCFSTQKIVHSFTLNLTGPEENIIFENLSLKSNINGMKELSMRMDDTPPEKVNGNQFFINLVYNTPGKGVGGPIVLKGKKFIKFLPNKKPTFVKNKMQITTFITKDDNGINKSYQLFLIHNVE